MEAQVRHAISELAIWHQLVLFMLAFADSCKDTINREKCLVLTVSSCHASVSSALCPPGQQAALREMCRGATLAAPAQVQAVSRRRACLQPTSSSALWNVAASSC